MARSSLENFNVDQAVVRMKRIMLGLGLVGSVGFGIAEGGSWGAGFLAGAAISYASFHFTHRFVMSMGKPGGPKPAAWRSVLAGLRYLIIAAVVYVMINVFGLNTLAALCGLLVAAAAAMLEILYELIHGT